MRCVGRDGLRGRGGNRTWPRARSEKRRQGTPSEAKEWPWRPAEIVAALGKVCNQFVGDLDVVVVRLFGTGPELLYGLPGSIAQLAVDAALKAVEPPQQCCRRAGHGPRRLDWL